MHRDPSVSRTSVLRARRRLARAAIGAAVPLTTLAVAVGAQQLPSGPQPVAGPGWELVVPAGRLIPTGSQRASIRRGGMNAVQVSYVPRPSHAFTATFGWARSRDISLVDTPKLDVFAFDLGVERRGPRWFADHRVTLRPFVGLGGGMRSYNHRSLDVDATHNLAGYASAGGELGIWRLRLRLEARDYVTGFRPLSGAGRTEVRNDVVLLAGLRLAGL